MVRLEEIIRGASVRGVLPDDLANHRCEVDPDLGEGRIVRSLFLIFEAQEVVRQTLVMEVVVQGFFPRPFSQ
jgi:hypothetical protein